MDDAESQQNDLQVSHFQDVHRTLLTFASHSKSISYAVYYPSLRRAHVTLARGVHFSTIGHSAPRKVLVKDEEKVQKRLELLPEEAIYLIERGSILCFLAPPRSTSLAVESDFLDLNLAESNLTPMSVQQTYSLLLSPSDPDGLTQDHYVVYAYLKRLGYTVTRTAPPKESEDWWISPPPFSPSLLTRSGTQETGILARVYRFFSHPLAWFWKGSQRSQSRTPTALRDWWHPISFLSWLKSRNTYGTLSFSSAILAKRATIASLFRSLRFIPAGYTLPVHCSTPSSSMSSPYTPFFNVYKPPTPYKKSAPAPPDYQISVVKYVLVRDVISLFNVQPITVHVRPQCQHFLSLKRYSGFRLKFLHYRLNDVVHSLKKTLNLLRNLQAFHVYSRCSPAYSGYSRIRDRSPS